MKARVPFTIMNGLVTQVLLQGHGNPKTILILLTMVWSWRGTASTELIHPKDFIVFHCAWGRFIGVCRVCFQLSNWSTEWNDEMLLAVKLGQMFVKQYGWLLLYNILTRWFFVSIIAAMQFHSSRSNACGGDCAGRLCADICQLACHVQSAAPPDSFFLKRARF